MTNPKPTAEMSKIALQGFAEKWLRILHASEDIIVRDVFVRDLTTRLASEVDRVIEEMMKQNHNRLRHEDAKWFTTLHAQKIADKMVEERLREELIAYKHYETIFDNKFTTVEDLIDEYIKNTGRE